MPKLSKIRLTGCKYDGLRKEHENSIFDLTKGQSPDHSLFTLENGGGKGVMMQLIFQLLLPETRWGKNNGNQVISMFYDKRNNLQSFTFHVVLEWVLDSLPEKRLISGIAVKSTIKNTSGEDEEKTGLSYFLYTHEHDNNGYFSVENLPLYDYENKEAIDLKVLEEFLNNNKRDFIKYSSTSARRRDSDYHRYLQSRGIYRSEWTILKEINKSEGGISDYFRNSSDNKSIFDKVIIPAITENIRNYSNDDGNSLIEMFKSNLSITKDLPVLLKRERNYQELIFNIEPLIKNADSGTRYIDRGQRLIDEGNNILYILNDEKNFILSQIDKWDKSYQEAERTRNELKFAKDNLNYNDQRNDFLEIQGQVDKYKEKWEEEKAKLIELEENLILYNINRILYDIKEVEKNIENDSLKKENLIKALNLEDSRDKLEELDYKIELEWENTKSKWQENEIEYNAYLSYNNGLIKEENRKKKKHIEKRDNLLNEINKFQLEKDHLKTKKAKLEGNYDLMSLNFPERILQDLNKDKDKNQKDLSKLEDEKLEIGKKIACLREEINKEEYILGQEGNKRAKLKEKISIQEKEELDLAILTSKILMENYKGAFLDRSYFTKALERLEDLEESKNETLQEVQRNIWEINIDKSLSNEGYFVPNKDVFYLKDEIAKMNIHVETGPEYLLNLKKEDRETLLEANKGFIYSLVISSERDWQIIQQNIRKDIFLNNMIPIYVRSQMNKLCPSTFYSLDNRADSLIDSENYYAWKDRLETDFNKLESTRINIVEDMTKIRHTKDKTKVLIERELLYELDKTLNELEDLILKRQDKIRNFKEEFSDYENKLIFNLDEIEVKNKNLEKILEEIRLMEDYHVSLQALKEKEIHINAVEKELERIKTNVLDIEINIEDILNRNWAIKDSFSNWKIKIEHIVKRTRTVFKDLSYEVNIDKDYKTFKIPDLSIRADDLLLILDERENLEKDISGKNSEIAVLDNSLAYYYKELARYENELMAIDRNWKRYEDLNLPLIEIEIIIKEIKKKIEMVEKEIDHIKSKKFTLEGKLSTLKKNLDTKAEEILKLYGRGPLVLEDLDITKEINNVSKNLESNKVFIGTCRQEIEKNEKTNKKLMLNLDRLRYSPELDFSKGRKNDILRNKIIDNVDSLIDNFLDELANNRLEIKTTIREGEEYREKFLKFIKINVEEEKIKAKLLEAIRGLKVENFISNKNTFTGMKTHFEQERLSSSKVKERAEEAMRQWTNRASIYVIKMIETLKDMVSSMNYINENQHLFPLVKLKGGERLPKEEDDVRYLLEEHFIQSISKVLEENENIENLDKRFLEDLMGDNVIFSKALQGTYPILLVYKMTENNEFRYAKAREEHYTTWEAINKGEGVSTEGSGGQTLSVTTFVTMMIMSFKKKHIGNENPSTVLILDNPFGQASGKHVLDPIFEIADKLNFQLICFAAPEIIKMEISERFPIFWELRIEEGKIIHGGRVIK